MPGLRQADGFDLLCVFLGLFIHWLVLFSIKKHLVPRCCSAASLRRDRWASLGLRLLAQMQILSAQLLSPRVPLPPSGWGTHVAKGSRGPLWDSEGWAGGIQVLLVETFFFEKGPGGSREQRLCQLGDGGQGRSKHALPAKGLLRRERLLCPAASEGLRKHQAELAGLELGGRLWSSGWFRAFLCLADCSSNICPCEASSFSTSNLF